jgi:hypothetical protein
MSERAQLLEKLHAGRDEFILIVAAHPARHACQIREGRAL